MCPMTSDKSVTVAQKYLAHKLLVTFHLNVIERKQLPGGFISFTWLVAAVQEMLTNSGWFPLQLKPGEDIGDGTVVEARNSKIWVHEQHEIGMLRYSQIKSELVPTIEEAVRRYVRATGGSPIDGVKIDWKT